MFLALIIYFSVGYEGDIPVWSTEVPKIYFYAQWVDMVITKGFAEHEKWLRKILKLKLSPLFNNIF